MSANPEKIDQYHQALNDFAPPGKLIPRSPDSALQRVLRSQAEDFALIHEFAESVAFDWIPTNTVDRLQEWEQSCNLPDCEAQVIGSIESRRAQVNIRLSQNAGRVDGRNGSSAAPGYLKEQAAQAGFEVSIKVRYPIRFGAARFGQSFGSPGKIDVIIHSFNYGVVSERLRFGSTRFGQPYANVDLKQLECLFNRIGPARYQIFYHLQEEA